jgi:hypothetical protein
MIARLARRSGRRDTIARTGGVVGTLADESPKRITLASRAVGRIGLLWRGDREARADARSSATRLRPIFEALAAVGVDAEPVVFDDDLVAETRAQLLKLDGALVWVDPIMGDRDRTVLDVLLREVAEAGVWVSAHPHTIEKMGTKDVLVATRELGWGSDTHVYRSGEELARDLPGGLSTGARVLKPSRGNGGIGVWKVEVAPGQTGPIDAGAVVRVQDARPRDEVTTDLVLRDFLAQRSGEFAGGGRIIDQPFQPRIAEGMVRCYLVRDEVVGFAHQSPTEAGANALSSRNIFGLPSAKTMYDASEAGFAALRSAMQDEWVPGMLRLTGVDAASMPMLWDADFLYGPRTRAGDDTYVLCEINVQSVLPFPPGVPAKLASAVAARCSSTGSARSAD